MLRPFVDRRIRHQGQSVEGVVESTFSEGASTYARVFVPAWGSTLPYVKVLGGTPATGRSYTLTKQRGLWVLDLG